MVVDLGDHDLGEVARLACLPLDILDALPLLRMIAQECVQPGEVAVGYPDAEALFAGRHQRRSGGAALWLSAVAIACAAWRSPIAQP